MPFEQAVKSDLVERFDFREHYVADLENVIDFDVIRSSGVRLGIDPLGGASVNYWPLMNEKYNLTIDVVRPQVDPTWSFMTIDHDGKIRMDPSSPYAMKGLVDSSTTALGTSTIWSAAPIRMPTATASSARTGAS